MKQIFWGAFFILLDFNLITDGGAIGLLPDFVGYLLLIFGLSRMERKEVFLQSQLAMSKKMAVILSIMTLYDYIQSIFGWQIGGIEVMIIWGTAEIFLSYCCWRKIIYGFAEIEKHRGVDLKSSSLLRALSMMILAQALALALVPIGTILRLIAIVGGLVINLYFLVELFYADREYDKFCKG